MDPPLPPDFDPYRAHAMNEPNWYEIGLGAVAAVGGWLFRRHVGRVDQIEERYVTREELEKAMKRMGEDRKELRDDRLRMHQENTDALQYIRERVDALVDRNSTVDRR